MLDALSIAKQVFKMEAAQIAGLTERLTDSFEAVVKLIMSTKGKIVITGMGKSGIIGKKIAATLASTGTSSFFMHPGEAYHGDLGMIEQADIVFLISNSGETDEVLKLIPFLKTQQNITVSMTGNPESTLSKNTCYHLNVGVDKEACPLQLAPTSSTTATLVMGDALAVALMRFRNFKDEQFAKFHPGGSLGKKLLTQVKDVMNTSPLPRVSVDDFFSEVIDVMTTKRLGLCVVFDGHNPIGIITDGDLRRTLKNTNKIRFNVTAREMMTLNPKFILESTMVAEAEKMMMDEKIHSLLVTNKQKEVVGVFQMYDSVKVS